MNKNMKKLYVSDLVHYLLSMYIITANDIKIINYEICVL